MGISGDTHGSGRGGQMRECNGLAICFESEVPDDFASECIGISPMGVGVVPCSELERYSSQGLRDPTPSWPLERSRSPLG
jgi:hypothetical protein